MGKKAIVTGSGIKYVDRTDYVPELDDPDLLREQAEKKEKRKAASKPRAKHDPKLVKQARELRDRYLEEVNERGLLPEAWDGGKYDVSRALPASGFSTEAAEATEETKLLSAPAGRQAAEPASPSGPDDPASLRPLASPRIGACSPAYRTVASHARAKC